MSSLTNREIETTNLTPEDYKPYGELIEADESLVFSLANMGTAKRFNHLCAMQNLRQDKANLNLCVFRCSPFSAKTLELKLLEKHQHSSQAFIPMSKTGKYLAVVCLGASQPDLSTLKAFLVEGPRGISYYPGVWHYPMTALESALDFACLVYEDGSDDDCQLADLEAPVSVRL